MAIKVTGYRMFTSTGGNSCIQCNVRMRKGLPYLSPIRGKKVIHEVKGRSLCISCLLELHGNSQEMLSKLDTKEIDRFQTRRFIEHMDKGDEKKVDI